MNSSPIDSHEGAEVIFAFGEGSLGVWVFLVPAPVIFVGVAVRMTMVETRDDEQVERAADPPA